MDWRERAYLFANGSFKIIHGDTLYKEDEWGVHDGGIVVYSEPNPDVIAIYPHTPQCTLIARKIEDMPKSELREIIDACGFHHLDQALDDGRADVAIDYIRSERDGFLELLSRGVYPFPWPDDGSVITEGEV